MQTPLRRFTPSRYVPSLSGRTHVHLDLVHQVLRGRSGGAQVRPQAVDRMTPDGTIPKPDFHGRAEILSALFLSVLGLALP